MPDESGTRCAGGPAMLQLIGTIETSVDDAQEAITFGGDAGAMVLGTMLMLMFFAGPESRLRTNQLRWGFAAIGAAALIDPFATWVSARTDPEAIPFGEIEGVGRSDPSKLEELYGWTVHQLVHRHDCRDRVLRRAGDCVALLHARGAPCGARMIPREPATFRSSR